MKSIIRIIAIIALVFCAAIPSFAQTVAKFEKVLIQGCDTPDPGNEDHYE